DDAASVEESVSHGSKSINPLPPVVSQPTPPGPSLQPQKLFSAFTDPPVPLYIPIELPLIRLKLPDTLALTAGVDKEKLSTSIPTTVVPVTLFAVNAAVVASRTYMPIP